MEKDYLCFKLSVSKIKDGVYYIRAVYKSDGLEIVSGDMCCSSEDIAMYELMTIVDKYWGDKNDL